MQVTTTEKKEYYRPGNTVIVTAHTESGKFRSMGVEMKAVGKTVTAHEIAHVRELHTALGEVLDQLEKDNVE